MTTNRRVYAALNDNTRKGIALQVRSYFKGFHRTELIWSDGVKCEYNHNEFKEIFYLS